MCFIRPKKGDLVDRYKSVLDKISELSAQEKRLIEFRFFTIIRELEASCNKVHYYFHLFRWLITSGSLIIPALLSIQNIDDEVSLIKNHTLLIYWTTWFLSIAVSACNAYYTLYKIDKQYYLYNSVYEVIRSEGWQYFQLSGKYSGHFLGDNETPTHKNQFTFFCVEIERIKMRLVAEEFIKGRDEEGNRRKNDRNREDTSSTEPTIVLPAIPKNRRRKRDLRKRNTRDRIRNRRGEDIDTNRQRDIRRKEKKRSMINIGNVSRASTPPNLDFDVNTSSLDNLGIENMERFGLNSDQTNIEIDTTYSEPAPTLITIKSPKAKHSYRKPNEFTNIVIENTGIKNSTSTSSGSGPKKSSNDSND
jgi:hypothetical protein